MITTFTVQKRTVAAGKKIEVRIFAGDKEIGKRTSPRAYGFALVVKRDQAQALTSARANLKYQHEQLAEHRIYLLDPAFKYAAVVPEWISNDEIAIQQLTQRVAELESGPLPEFDEIYVTSWHGTRRNVPNNIPSANFVAIVEIPQTP